MRLTRVMLGHPLRVALAFALPAVFPVAAQGTVIPGATYAGTAAGGATISFTVASDATIVNSYKICGAQGRSSDGGSCQFLGAGDAGYWEGAPIVDDGFGYSVGPQNLLQGTFTGAQSASGTFRLYNPAAGPAPSCDTGTVSWTASTTASPPSAGGSGGVSGHGKVQTKSVYGTRITVLEASAKQFDGRLVSPSRLCSARRVITDWVGVLRERTTRTRSNGTFTFPRTSSMGGQQVRTGVSALGTRSATCAAASSAFIGV